MSTSKLTNAYMFGVGACIIVKYITPLIVPTVGLIGAFMAITLLHIICIGLMLYFLRD